MHSYCTHEFLWPDFHASWNPWLPLDDSSVAIYYFDPYNSFSAINYRKRKRWHDNSSTAEEFFARLDTSLFKIEIKFLKCIRLRGKTFSVLIFCRIGKFQLFQPLIPSKKEMEKSKHNVNISVDYRIQTYLVRSSTSHMVTNWWNRRNHNIIYV